MKKENKNIERLFQEKFKDFEVSPPDFVWENIQEKLHPKEKKRRVIPFWFKTAGIAASFITIVSVIFYNTNTDFNNTKTVNTNSVVNSKNNQENNDTNQNIGTNKFNTSVSNKKQNNSNSSFSNEVGSNSETNSIVNNNTTNSGSNSKTDSKFNQGSLQNSKIYKSNNGFVSNRKNQNKTTSFKKNKTQFNSSNSEIVANGSNRNKWNRLKSNSKLNNFNSSKNNISNSDLIAFNTSNKNNDSNFELTNTNDINSSNTISKNTNEINDVLVESNPINKNSTTTIAIVEEIKTDTITLATVTIEENPMEKLLREKETKKVVDEKEKRSKWAVNSYVSPIFFNSFASGSPLSEEFASNEKTFNNSTSYGVGVAYNINKRLSVKTGVSNLNLDFDTENIAFYSTFEDQSKIANTNIERNANGKYIVLKHEKEFSKNEVENQVMQSSQNTGNLNQRTQYIEVPLELSYAILNKKFGVAIKGGMSTLFLTENEVTIKAPDGNMQIGKASNLNEVHFSSNVGLGLSYSFMKNFQLNVEPTLKYQINTFNKNSEDFTPYVIGVNTGISYKF